MQSDMHEAPSNYHSGNRAYNIAHLIEQVGGADTLAGVGRRQIQARLGVSEWIARRIADALRDCPPSATEIRTAPRVDDRGESLEDLVARRAAAFTRRLRAADQGAHQVTIRGGLPIGIAHLGDCHVDADGADLPELNRWRSMIQRTPGMYAATVGDVSNNWGGRLAHLYAHQGTSVEEARRLTEWFFSGLHWFYVISGNHESMTPDGEALFKRIARGAAVEVYEQHEARIEIRWPDISTTPYRIVARHDFPGNSQWNAVHGLVKKSRLDRWGDMYVCGHKHHMGHYQEEMVGRIVHSIRLTGFKTIDDYASALGFAPSRLGHGCVTIIDPRAAPAARTTIYWEPDEAGELLTWLRQRRAK